MSYGQYSESGSRHMSERDMLWYAPLAGRGACVKWGNNRIAVTYPDRVEYRLHATAIVTKYANGRVLVNFGGYNTPTTKRAIQQALTLCGFNWPFAGSGNGRVFVNTEETGQVWGPVEEPFVLCPAREEA